MPSVLVFTLVFSMASIFTLPEALTVAPPRTSAALSFIATVTATAPFTWFSVWSTLLSASALFPSNSLTTLKATPPSYL